jgi:hypothetical protein
VARLQRAAALVGAVHMGALLVDGALWVVGWGVGGQRRGLREYVCVVDTFMQKRWLGDRSSHQNQPGHPKGQPETPPFPNHLQLREALLELLGALHHLLPQPLVLLPRVHQLKLLGLHRLGQRRGLGLERLDVGAGGGKLLVELLVDGAEGVGFGLDARGVLFNVWGGGG